MASYKSLYFQSPDPISKEVVSRTTRYRLRKKRKATNSYSQSGKVLEQGQESLEHSDTDEEFQCNALIVHSDDLSESQSQTRDLAHGTTDCLLGTSQEHVHSNEMELSSLEVNDDEMFQDPESEYPPMDLIGGHDPHYMEAFQDNDLYSEDCEELQQNELEVTDHSLAILSYLAYYFCVFIYRLKLI